MNRDVLFERFFNALISGDRTMARELVDELLENDCPVEKILSRLIWPTLQHIQDLHRNDQLSELSHNYATRLLRTIVPHLQLRLERGEARGKTVLLCSGAEQSEEIAAQMVADLLDADGYQVFYAGGGIANDEIVSEVGNLDVDVLVIFGAVPATVPATRVLIDRLHEIEVCPNLQIVVGGGVFNRADGLAEEIGADLWGADPEEVVRVMAKNPDRRMTAEQRTVGRRRRSTTKRSAAA